jgi:hypothetical protein
VLRTGRGARAGVHEAPNQGGQVDAPVYAALRFGQIAVAVLAEIEVVASASNGGLDVGNEDVDPAERSQLTGVALTGDDCTVGGNLRRGGIEARQAVSDQMGLGVEGRPRPLRECLSFVVAALSCCACWSAADYPGLPVNGCGSSPFTLPGRKR